MFSTPTIKINHGLVLTRIHFQIYFIVLDFIQCHRDHEIMVLLKKKNVQYLPRYNLSQPLLYSVDGKREKWKQRFLSRSMTLKGDVVYCAVDSVSSCTVQESEVVKERYSMFKQRKTLKNS